jgi:hypothetical protein
MQDQQILNSTITIEEVVDKGKKLSLKANDGNRTFTYSIWKTKQDGNDSASYSQYKNMGLGVGSTVMIGYVIDEYTTDINGVSKQIQSKKIINFREASSVPGSQTPAPAQSPRGGANNASQGYSGDAFGRRLAVHGFVNAMISSGIKPTDISSAALGALLTLENRIDEALSAPLDGANLDLPTIDVNEDLGVDLPF